MLVSTILQFYISFQAPRCPQDSKSGCFRPLFLPEEKVEVHAFLTTKDELEWWTAEGLGELMSLPFFNISAEYGQLKSTVQAKVPLSLPELQSVRQNETVLFAHCFLVRSGARLEGEIQKMTEAKQHPQRGVVSEHVLHTRASVVKLLPQVLKAKRNLLQAEQDMESSEHVFKRKMLGWELTIYPRSILPWAGLLFVITSFAEPSLFLASVRHCLVSLIAGLLKISYDQVSLAKQAGKESALFFAPAPVMPHLNPSVLLEIAADSEEYDERYPAPLLYKEMVFEHGQPFAMRERDVRYDVRLLPAGTKVYAPPFYVDTWSVRPRHWIPLDSNTSRSDPFVHAQIEFSGMIKYSARQTMMEAMKQYMQMGLTERDLDEVKDFMFRQPLHIMAIMQVVSLLQMSLWTLAFKNDVSFFRGRHDYTGLSSRSLGTDALQELIIFLYLYDFDGISRLILFQLGMQAAFGLWKYARVARLGLSWTYLLPWVTYGRLAEASAEQQTDEIDARGMHITKCIVYPALVCCCLYNLTKYNYKSWWSWLISSMADFAYGFGFINMLPQIFINYKLRSVAHMPWRVLIYKFFNTFIDDVYAFFIAHEQMTAKHRYMTLRDDIVFFVFLYQRYIYKVDHSRPDEFGFVYDSDSGPKEIDGKASLKELADKETSKEVDEKEKSKELADKETSNELDEKKAPKDEDEKETSKDMEEKVLPKDEDEKERSKDLEEKTPKELDDKET